MAYEEEIEEYRKSPLQVELGDRADPKLVEELVREISLIWVTEGDKPVVPTLVLFGGFQGSGKTTVINELQQSANDTFIVISPDEIRNKLFEKISFSDVFVHTVFAARNKLLQKALETGQHVLMDENSTPLRINLFNSFAEQQQDTRYKVLSVFLEAPKETLAQRVESRFQVPGRYAGKVDELLASMEKHGNIDLSGYSIVIDTVKDAPTVAASVIFDTIQSLQGQLA
ncbi:hypothetical protein A3F29_02140 [Candidatus Roizmanbacteria bacterium RIFCSPHIGHO2_12_FULL_33_9]|uniref:Uncharacterized protein n=1 Tax=Candidatus Roizmanbacteria bacterium RIFCSPHIGHO2_12_FULL_33_9 TaxID=1802045 RepID=A0A1F7HJW5_9BACT|nr:MAG: hypothetical protein A3F29_02140 [Candidatus Roizmanbacteria bacterium RIFCSPHIGHO2_12_FULL_33_9]